MARFDPNIWLTGNPRPPGLPFYRDKLHEETVYKRFGEILTKVSRPEVLKPEAKPS